MLKISINLYCKMHWSAKAIDTTCRNLDSNIQGGILKIDVTKNRFSWCMSQVKGVQQRIHSPGNFLLAIGGARIFPKRSDFSGKQQKHQDKIALQIQVSVWPSG